MRSRAQKATRPLRAALTLFVAGVISVQLGCEGGVPVRPSDVPATSGSLAPQAAGPSIPCVVSEIVDGDSIECRDSRRVRLLLIDAPEMAQRPWGEVSRQALLSLLPTGTTVALEIDIESEDQYGRTLAYVRLPDGRIANEELLRMGVAVVLAYQPNLRHVSRFRAVSQEAEAVGRGLWALDAFSCLPAGFRARAC